MSDSLPTTHFLMRERVDKKSAREVGRIVDDVASVLRDGSADFLRHFSSDPTAALQSAWSKATRSVSPEPTTIGAKELREMTLDKKDELFAIADDLTIQKALIAAHPRAQKYLKLVHRATGTEIAHRKGQELMHVIRVSLGDRGSEWQLGKAYKNGFARVICRNIKYCLYTHAVHVLIGDKDGAEATRDLVEKMPMALPIACGEFQGKVGPIFMIDRPSTDS